MLLSHKKIRTFISVLFENTYRLIEEIVWFYIDRLDIATIDIVSSLKSQPLLDQKSIQDIFPSSKAARAAHRLAASMAK
jgi:hypothetical protein